MTLGDGVNPPPYASSYEVFTSSPIKRRNAQSIVQCGIVCYWQGKINDYILLHTAEGKFFAPLF
jgi:hypothetical protein